MGGTTAPVRGSGSCPEWIARVSNSCEAVSSSDTPRAYGPWWDEPPRLGAPHRAWLWVPETMGEKGRKRRVGGGGRGSRASKSTKRVWAVVEIDKTGPYQPPWGPLRRAHRKPSPTSSASPQWHRRAWNTPAAMCVDLPMVSFLRSEEHTSELQSRGHLVCRLLLEQKNQ